MTAPMSFIQQGMWQELADAVSHSDLAHDMDATSFLENAADTMKNLLKASKKGMPMFMQTDAHQNSPIRSPEFFTYSCALVKDIIKETRGTPHEIDPEDVLSLFYLPPSKAGGLGDKDGTCVNAHLAKLMLAQDSRSLELLGMPKKLNLGKHYQSAFDKLANDDGQISVMLLRPKFDPMGAVGTNATKAIRRILPKYKGLLEIGSNNFAA